MRVDTQPARSNDLDIDHVTRLRSLLGALRRSWYLLAALTVIGAALGWVTTPAPPSADGPAVGGPQHVRATHTLLIDRIVQDDTTSVDLSQAAYLVLTGEIPETVATNLGLNLSEVEGFVLGVARPDVSSIEIRAIGTDPQRVTALADSTAEVLLTYLNDQARRAFEADRDEVVLELDRLDQELADLTGRIATNPPNLAQLEAQYQSLSNQYRLAYERFTQLAAQAGGEVSLRSLGPAKLTEITEEEYRSVRLQIRDGLPSTAVTTPEQGGDVLDAQAPEPGAGAATRAVVGGLVGLSLAVALVLVLDRFDTRLRSRDQTEAATSLPVVAEIPPLSRQQQHDLEVVANAQPRSRAAEAYRVIRGALLFHAGVEDPADIRTDGEGLTVLVTSANPAEGKTTTVANLAAVLAEGGLSVLVVNCDFRRPRVHKYLTPSDTTDTEPAIATGSGPLVLAGTRIPGVRLVTGLGESNPDANPLEVVALQRRIIQKARPLFDVILLDTAPFLTTNDASELLSETDHVLLVVRAGKTRRLAARRTAEILERFEAPVMGVVLNDSDETPAAQYYYTYYLEGSGKRKRSGGYVSRSRTDGGSGPSSPVDAGETPSVVPDAGDTASRAS